MQQSKKIGILGGTFDPIHLGHISLALKAYEQLELEKVIFIPSGISYLKKDRNVSLAKDRLNMVKLAIKNYNYFEASTIEIDRAGNSYTYETLEQIKQANPEYDLYFILGADSLLYIDKWVKPELIYKNATLVCAVRDQENILSLSKKAEELKENGARVLFLKMDPINISSTNIRKLVNTKKDFKEYVHNDVENYIIQEHLYEVL